MNIFATLFDSFYLDKGIVLYKSLEKVSNDFKLYVFCFDDQTKRVLDELKYEHLIAIHHSEFEDEKLLQLKEERSKAEYCWTCTPVIIDYVLNCVGEDSCTYIDSDLYFFSNPQCLFDEICNYNSDIVITPHRFSDSRRDRRLMRRSGEYCVEFNYFNQSNNARQALTWWKEKCAEWCFHLYEPERMGDQKYLEKFPILFNGVHELQHMGGGVAPWNLKQYELAQKTDNHKIILREKKTAIEFELIFYHFQNLRFINEHLVNISSETHDKNIKDVIYSSYLNEIKETRKMLWDKYNISFDTKKKYSSNIVISWLQGGLLRYKIKSFSDVYKI